MTDTVNDFIKELQNISPDKRELPMQIECPNGMLVYPKIRMNWLDRLNMFKKNPDSMVVTYR